MAQQEYKEIAIVKALTRYPVKSMGGEEVDATRVGWHGLAGDRRFALVRTGNLTGFPWLTARDMPSLVTYRAFHEKPDDLEHSSVRVRTPKGQDLDVLSGELLGEVQESFGSPVHMMHLWSGAFDANDVSIITQQSIASIGQVVSDALDVRRFRANIVLDASETREYPEKKWVGELLVFGDRPDSARLRVHRRDQRCVVVNINADTGIVGGELLKSVVQSQNNLLGVYGGADRPGTVRVGDVVRLAR